MPPKPRDPTAAVASSTARAPTTGSSGAAPGAAPRARTPAGGEDTHSLEVANVRLRRDLDACREQLAAAVFCPIPGGPPEHASASSAWISAQLEQSRRQVLVLSEMLATRADVTIELEAVLLQLRQPAADGTRSDAAVWAGNALKRLHGVQWVEAIAQDIVDGMAALPSGGSHRCSAGNGAPATQQRGQGSRTVMGKAGSSSVPRLLSSSAGSSKLTKAEKRRLNTRYSRGEGNTPKGVTKPVLKRSIKRQEAKISAAERQAAQAEVLQPTEAGYLEAEGPLERTARVRQSQLAGMVDVQTAQKAYDVQLDQLGPYRVAFTPNGRRVLLGGRKGHVAVAQWEGGFRVLSEIQVRETVRDVCFLHDHTSFAVAQHKNLYIYDQNGTELHCLRTHRPQVNRLAFLRYHWLLATVGPQGALRYLDVSTGENVAEHRTRLGDCDCMRANPWNAVLHLGHSNGAVTLWTPNLAEPVAKLLCHKGAVADIAIDRGGRYMATAGKDGTLKVWDVRTFRPLHSYTTPRPVSSMDVSDRGLLAAACGAAVHIYKDGMAARAGAPYMTHRLPGREAECLRFCPFEDVLGIGHSKGYSSILVPGAGEANFDAFEANPYQTVKQRREAEVVSLLEKLPPDSIMLDPTMLGKVDRDQRERQKEMAVAKAKRIEDIKANKRAKRKTRGRSKASRRAAKKEGNIVDAKRERRRAQLEEQAKAAEHKAANRKAGGAGAPPKPFDPLDRFAPPAAAVGK